MNIVVKRNETKRDMLREADKMVTCFSLKRKGKVWGYIYILAT